MHKCKLFDTRGILHLHLIPSLLGAITAACTCASFDNVDIQNYYGGGNNLRSQLLFNRGGREQGGY